MNIIIGMAITIIFSKWLRLHPDFEYTLPVLIATAYWIGIVVRGLQEVGKS